MLLKKSLNFMNGQFEIDSDNANCIDTVPVPEPSIQF